jgi:predicted SnoaL-like aldol condensation-catalyzing enzyme
MIRTGVAALVLASALTQALAAEDADLKFLERRNLDHPQSTPLPMPQSSWEVREHNKQVVLDFYKIISDKRQWTTENARKYFWPDFIQHDPADPDTSSAFFAFFNTMRPPSSAADAAAGGSPPPGPRKQPGNYSVDSNGSPLNWMVAEGDIVVVARHRNWDWKDGPAPVYEGVFVDIWRVVDGKLKEQWCTATPADANLAHIREFLDKGLFPKTKE